MTKILLIEDDEQLIKLYTGIFKDAGFEVFSTQTGEVGLDLAIRERPKVILLDIMLPGGMNGLEILERLKARQEFKDVPIFILTNLEGEELTAKELGANEYIIKANINPKEIVEKIRKVVN